MTLVGVTCRLTERRSFVVEQMLFCDLTEHYGQLCGD